MIDAESLVPDYDPLRLAVVVSWQEYGRIVYDLALKVAQNYEPQVLVGIFRGGWMVAQGLADHFPSARIMGARAVSTGTSSSAEFVLTEDGDETASTVLAGKRVLLVDEVIESGRTARFFREHVRALLPAEVKFACTHQSANSIIEADFSVVRFKEPTNYVLPWRLYRDTWCLIGDILRSGNHTDEQIRLELKIRFGVELDHGAIDQALETLMTRGVVKRNGKFWNLTGA